MRNQAKVFGVFLLLGAGLAHGALYRWVDAQGQVHYGQFPPPGVAAIPIKPMPSPKNIPPQPGLKEQLEAFEQRQAGRQQDKAAQVKAKEDAKGVAQNCQAAREALEVLTSHAQVSIQEGERTRRLSDKERQAELDKTKTQVETFCPKSVD